MRYFSLLVVLFSASSARSSDVPKFEMQEISKDLSIGYAVITADINGDGKPDIVVVDKHRVIWFENPTWKMHTILTGKTKPDNVCVAALDIDGDGKIDLVIGADWAPFNTKSGGTLQWLKQPKNLDDEWEMFPICEEPTVHRVKVVPNLYGPKKPGIVLAPLMGRDATKEANWMDGRPVRILSFPIPADPQKGPWKADVISEELHVVHNFEVNESLDYNNKLQGVVKGYKFYCANYEGVSQISRNPRGQWTTKNVLEGDQSNIKSNRGSSEIASRSPDEIQQSDIHSFPFVATIEPWHGNQVVVYSAPSKPNAAPQRTVIDNNLRWGHAIKIAKFAESEPDSIVVGVRDNPAKGDQFAERCGIRIYQSEDKTGTKWKRNIIDDGGIAVEDLAVCDLDGDGRPDIIAVGRATKNARIYWNKGK